MVTRRRGARHRDTRLDLGQAVRASNAFEEPTITRRHFTVTFSADRYATNLSTQSAVKQLSAEARHELIERVKQRVGRCGGSGATHLLAMLTVACRT